MDICDTCAFEDACPSAHFHPTGRNVCADYKTMLKDGGTAKNSKAFQTKVFEEV